MNKSKTYYHLTILCLSVLLLSGCSFNYMASLYNNEQKISSDTNTYSITVTEQNINSQQFTGSIELIEGMDTLWTFEADEDMDLDMTYRLNVLNGKAKLVLILPDRTAITLIETNNQSSVEDYAINKLPIKKGNNRIKIVADRDTTLEFDISIPEGDFHELGL